MGRKGHQGVHHFVNHRNKNRQVVITCQRLPIATTNVHHILDVQNTKLCSTKSHIALCAAYNVTVKAHSVLCFVHVLSN